MKLTANAPENRPKPNKKGSSSNHPFLGVFAVSFREGSPKKSWDGGFFWLLFCQNPHEVLVCQKTAGKETFENFALAAFFVS